MDDEEYYKIKRIASVNIQQIVKVKRQLNASFKTGNVYQGHDDAEMLLEKQQGFDSISDDNEENN